MNQDKSKYLALHLLDANILFVKILKQEEELKIAGRSYYWIAQHVWKLSEEIQFKALVTMRIWEMLTHGSIAGGLLNIKMCCVGCFDRVGEQKNNGLLNEICFKNWPVLYQRSLKFVSKLLCIRLLCERDAMMNGSCIQHNNSSIW